MLPQNRLESTDMLFLQISKHAPESCPVNNEKSMKTWRAFEAKREQLMKKHGVKLIWAWHDPNNHRFVMVWDGSLEKLMEWGMEREIMAFGAIHNTEFVPVTTYEECVKLFMK
jgi:hypothetical protein